MGERRRTRGLQKDPASGIWQCDKVVRGIRICESTGTRDEVEAERYLARRIEEVRQQTIYGVRPSRTFRQAATKYLTDFIGKRSIGRDALALKDLDPYIGHLPLERVHAATLQPYIDERTGRAAETVPSPLKRRQKHLKWKTIVRNIATVRRILNLAARVWRHENGVTWLETAPLLQLARKEEKAKERKPYPLDWDEQRLLFRELAGHLERMATFKVNAGVREDEVCQLRWAWEQRVQGVGSVFVIPDDFTKNCEPRVVVLNDVAQAIVDEQRGKHPTHVFCYIPPEPSGKRVYLRRRLREQGLAAKGVALSTDQLALAALAQDREPRPLDRMHSSGWRAARRRAAKLYKEELGRECPEGFRQIRVHDLKHTFGRRLRAAGVGLEDRQDLLGHKNGKITTHYSQAELLDLKSKANLVNERRDSVVLLRVVGSVR